MNKSLIYNAVFPPRCIFCGELIRRGTYACKSCAETLPYIEDKRCFHCGLGKSNCCCKEHKNREWFDFFVAPFYYEGGVRHALLRLKSKKSYAEPLSREMVKVIKKYFGSVRFDAVLPVPLAKNKLKARGFNSAGALACETAEKLGCESIDALKIIYRNEVQHSLYGVFRSGNVKGVYDVSKPELVKGKTLLLVDDIKTSGATLSECALMLKLYGAKSVYAVSASADKREKHR